MATLHALDKKTLNKKEEGLYTLRDGKYQEIYNIPAKMIAEKFNK